MKIFVDIDNTICYYEGNDTKKMEYDKALPYKNRIDKINKLYDEGHKIIYWTARGSVSRVDYYQFTIDQLKSWGCIFHDLIVGYRDGNLCHSTKPHFDMYICDKSWNSESFFHRQKLELP